MRRCFCFKGCRLTLKENFLVFPEFLGQQYKPQSEGLSKTFSGGPLGKEGVDEVGESKEVAKE